MPPQLVLYYTTNCPRVVYTILHYDSVQQATDNGPLVLSSREPCTKQVMLPRIFLYVLSRQRRHQPSQASLSPSTTLTLLPVDTTPTLKAKKEG